MNGLYANWLGFVDADAPRVVSIVAIPECNEKPVFAMAPHVRKKPLRRERSRGPLTAPASFMKARLELTAIAFSSCSRTMRLFEIPVRLAVSSSQATASDGRRMVIV
jgi:hypothetical protein